MEEGDRIKPRHSTCESCVALGGFGLDPVRFGWLCRPRVPVVSIWSIIGCIVRSLWNGWVGPLSSGKRSPRAMGYLDCIASFCGTHRLHSALDDLTPAQFDEVS